MSRPPTPADRTRRALLLGPGVGAVSVGCVSLLRASTVVGWLILALGLALLLGAVVGSVVGSVVGAGHRPAGSGPRPGGPVDRLPTSSS